MAVIPDNIFKLDIRGQFSGLTDDQVVCFIEEAELQVGSAWGACRDQAVIYLTGHLIAKRLQGSSSPAGPVVGQSSGGLSRTYAGPTGAAISDLDFMTTTYGQDYMRLSKKVITTPLVLHSNG